MASSLDQGLIPEFILNSEETPNCATTDPEMFFAEEAPDGSHHNREYYRNVRSVKAVCNSCPLKLPCLEYALINREHGIWGGTTETDRNRLRRNSSITAISSRARRRVWES